MIEIFSIPKYKELMYKFRAYIEERRLAQSKETVRIGTNQDVIEKSKILYIQGEGKNTLVVLKNDEYITGKNINTWEEELNSIDFCRINSFTIINFRHVKKLQEKVELSDGSFREISTARRKRVLQQFDIFQRKI